MVHAVLRKARTLSTTTAMITTIPLSLKNRRSISVDTIDSDVDLMHESPPIDKPIGVTSTKASNHTSSDSSSSSTPTPASPPEESASSKTKTKSAKSSSKSSGDKKKHARRRKRRLPHASSTASNTSTTSNSNNNITNNTPAQPKESISGWIFFKNPSGKTPFRRVYCRLQEVHLKLYYSTDSSETAFESHVIMTVSRLHHINKGLQVTTYGDLVLWMYTSLYEDFEKWFAAFHHCVHSTRISRAFSAPVSVSSRSSAMSRSSVASNPRNSSTQSEPYVKAFSGWLCLKRSWWQVLRQRQQRRYFVLCGKTLSCFNVNREGQIAEFVKQVVAFRQEDDRLHIQLESGKTLALTATRSVPLEAWIRELTQAVGVPEEPREGVEGDAEDPNDARRRSRTFF